jgi:subtilase family serine protease
VDLSNQYIVTNNLASALSVSFGACEQALGTGNSFYNSLWQQAAAQGISVFVSSGDAGSAGCDNPNSTLPAKNGLGVNGLSSTPYNTAVGGTQFNEAGNVAAYWSSTNDGDVE